MENKVNNSEQQQIKGILYEENKMNNVLNLLNTIHISGVNDIKAMGVILDILTNPISFSNTEKIDTE